jgi:uncharacterized protein with PQ loop repeat
MFEQRDTSSTVFDALGVVGGVLNALCLVPQIVQLRRTMDGSGLHKRFFVISLFAFLLEFMYLVSINAWAAWIPMLASVY